MRLANCTDADDSNAVGRRSNCCCVAAVEHAELVVELELVVADQPAAAVFLVAADEGVRA